MMEAGSKQETRLVNQLHGLMARVFPELAVHVKDLSAGYVLELLDKYPTLRVAISRLTRRTEVTTVTT